MPRLAAAGHQVAVSGPFSFSGAPLSWQGFTVLPGGQDPFGSDVIAGHYAWHKADLLITLCDVFMMDPAPLKTLNVACWTPVDCDGMGAQDAAKLRQAGAQPVAMSRFGERVMRQAGFDPLYAPHSADTAAFRPPEDRDQVRASMGLTPGNFVIGLNAANKEGPRKALPEQLTAFAWFHADHPEARLVVHSLIEPKAGANLRAIAASLGISHAIFFPDQYTYVCGMMGAASIANWYGALDVLSNCSYGEGFGLPVLEAQACGVPVIITDSSSMSELRGAGWKVAGEPHWIQGHDSWWTRPSVAGIARAYEKAWRASRDGSMAGLRERARRFALRYDDARVFRRHWQPVLDVLDERRVRVMDAAARGAAWRPAPADERRDLLVIVPSRGRPENVKRLAAAVAETCEARTDLVFAFDDDDPSLKESAAAAEAGGASWENGPRRSVSAWINDIALASTGSYRALASIGDDHVPRTQGWDAELLAVLDASGPGFAYPDDAVRSDIPEAVVVSSEIVAALGWLCEPSLRHFYVDNVWADLGRRAGCITYLPDVLVEHVHPGVSGGAQSDGTYLEAVAQVGPDEMAYERWRAERMPADVATVRALRAGKAG